MAGPIPSSPAGRMDEVMQSFGQRPMFTTAGGARHVSHLAFVYPLDPKAAAANLVLRLSRKSDVFTGAPTFEWVWLRSFSYQPHGEGVIVLPDWPVLPDFKACQRWSDALPRKLMPLLEAFNEAGWDGIWRLPKVNAHAQARSYNFGPALEADLRRLSEESDVNVSAADPSSWPQPLPAMHIAMTSSLPSAAAGKILTATATSAKRAAATAAAAPESVIAVATSSTASGPPPLSRTAFFQEVGQHALNELGQRATALTARADSKPSAVDCLGMPRVISYREQAPAKLFRNFGRR